MFCLDVCYPALPPKLGKSIFGAEISATYTFAAKYVDFTMTPPNNAKGTRDFFGFEIKKRNHIFNTIRRNFELFGFAPLETPAIENIETLTGKYGEEGDQLLFRVLKSGDFMEGKPLSDFENNSLAALRTQIVDKGLRYDLTIPFARYVSKNHGQLALPFKRYQIQPVWRADRPAKGRYREFYQCDADVAGSNSLFSDTEFFYIIDRTFNQLSLPKAILKFSNRKLLYGMAEAGNFADRFIDMTVAIDKMDKIGWEGVENELRKRSFDDASISFLEKIFCITGSNEEKLSQLEGLLRKSSEGLKGIEECKSVLENLKTVPFLNTEATVDFSLARGLNYYTATIFEVVLENIAMGSVASGGRYDNLTGSFGLKNVAGVGMSFGAERIYDVMENLQLFPAISESDVQVLVCPMDETTLNHGFSLGLALRDTGIPCEFYPEADKIGKQLKFADRKKIPFALIIGSSEMEAQRFTLKNLTTGNQQSLSIGEIIDHLKSID